MRRSRRCILFRRSVPALLLLFLAPPASGGGPKGPAQGISAYLPDQAVIYDGSTSAGATLLLALSKEGFRVDLGEGRDPCPGSGRVPLSGLRLAGPAGQGVMVLDRALTGGPALMRMGEAPALPPDISDLEDDCDVLSRFSEVEAYLAGILDEAQGILDDAEALLETSRVVLCDTLDLIDAADPATPSSYCDQIGCFSSIVSDPADPSAPGPGGICSHATDLQSLLPNLLDLLRYHATRAEDAYLALVSHRGDVWTCIEDSGRVGKDCPAAGAWAEYGDVQSAVANMRGIFKMVTDFMEGYTLEAVESCCEHMGGLGSSPPLLSGAVMIFHRRQALGRFIGALEKAANSPTHPPDPGHATAYLDLAARLSQVQGDRVLQVIFRSDSQVGQHIVTVRSSEYPPDPGRPDVVILTALRRDAPLPPMSAEDVRTLLGAFRTFRDVLLPPRIGRDEAP